MITRHRLPLTHFAALAAGDGDAETVCRLKEAELSKRLLQIRALLDHCGAALEHAYDMLTEVQRRAPAVVADTICHPHVGAWAASCLHRVRSAVAGNSDLDLAQLGAIAAVAAIRANVEIAVAVPMRDGVVALPSLGSAEVGDVASTGMAVVRCRSGQAEIAVGDRKVRVPPNPECDAPGWRGLRRIRSRQNGHALEICIDDLDPFRDRHGLHPARRLTPAEVASWQRTLDGAWTILVRHHPHRAKALAVGLTTVVPLAQRGGTHGISATAIDAFGAVAMSPPHDPLLFAETLVHEFQHGKLGALLDLVPLYEADADERYYAPWRDDPRPLGGLLQGAYAYLGVTDFWRRQLHVADAAGAGFAEFQFALWHGQTLRAIHTLLASGRLTHLGRRFVVGMRTALSSWPDTSVSARARGLADDAAADHALVWRLRHVRSDHDAVDRLGRAWLDGARCPDVAVPATTVANRLPATPVPRADLRLHWIRSGRGGASLGGTALAADIDGVTGADIACVEGDYRAAVRGYLAQVATAPDDVAGWAGLALAMRHVVSTAAAGMLSTRPELVAAVHRRVRELANDAPDPEELAAWLALGCDNQQT